MLKCNEIVRILSSGEDLSWFRQTQLKFHLTMCKHCSRYADQLRLIAASAKRLFKSHAEQDTERLEERMIKEYSSKKKD